MEPQKSGGTDEQGHYCRRGQSEQFQRGEKETREKGKMTF